mmetsp:Transcript_29906/g.94305  ORF Transcript_29906/g.94305 Transcript_29906/m.94305 type:complete len:579 (-) Transcript_29906:306-2042(-)
MQLETRMHARRPMGWSQAAQYGVRRCGGNTSRGRTSLLRKVDSTASLSPSGCNSSLLCEFGAKPGEERLQTGEAAENPGRGARAALQRGDPRRSGARRRRGLCAKRRRRRLPAAQQRPGSAGGVGWRLLRGLQRPRGHRTGVASRERQRCRRPLQSSEILGGSLPWGRGCRSCSGRRTGQRLPRCCIGAGGRSFCGLPRRIRGSRRSGGHGSLLRRRARSSSLRKEPYCCLELQLLTAAPAAGCGMAHGPGERLLGDDVIFRWWVVQVGCLVGSPLVLVLLLLLLLLLGGPSLPGNEAHQVINVPLLFLLWSLAGQSAALVHEADDPFHGRLPRLVQPGTVQSIGRADKPESLDAYPPSIANNALAARVVHNLGQDFAYAPSQVDPHGLSLAGLWVCPHWTHSESQLLLHGGFLDAQEQLELHVVHACLVGLLRGGLGHRALLRDVGLLHDAHREERAMVSLPPRVAIREGHYVVLRGDRPPLEISIETQLKVDEAGGLGDVGDVLPGELAPRVDEGGWQRESSTRRWRLSRTLPAWDPVLRSVLRLGRLCRRGHISRGSRLLSGLRPLLRLLLGLRS